jgi:phosphoserine aminotransferase
VRGGASILLADKTVDYLYSYFCMNDIENCCYTTALKDGNSTLKVADCSSVLGLHPIDISQYSIVFGSAEHSIGITGCTIVIIREELIKANIKIPSMFSFEVMLRTNSIFNTPNCFAVYVLGENVKYLKQAYGAPEKAQ